MPYLTNSQPQDTKKLGSIIKHRKSDTVEIASLKDQGVLRDTPSEKAEILNRQFQTVFTEELEVEEDTHALATDVSYPNIPKLMVTTPSVHIPLESFNPNKTLGLDELHLRVLDQLAESLAPILQAIFTKSLKY